MIKEGILECHGGRKHNGEGRNMDAFSKLPFTQEFYKVYLMIETKILTLFDT